MSWEEYELFCATDPNKIGWNHPFFERIRDKLQEEKRFIENPIQLETGVMQCSKCKSCKTYSYQEQRRSADEGFTTFVWCPQCKIQWREN